VRQTFPLSFGPELLDPVPQEKRLRNDQFRTMRELFR
jgi:hypothetical protein